jgi:hypothetical protein
MTPMKMELEEHCLIFKKIQKKKNHPRSSQFQTDPVTVHKQINKWFRKKNVFLVHKSMLQINAMISYVRKILLYVRFDNDNGGFKWVG